MHGDDALTTASDYSLVIPNQIAALRKMSEWLQSALEEMGMNDQIMFRFDLCANEAVSNIIGYAYPDAGSHEIALRITLEAERLSLGIEDDGIPFNPLVKPKKQTPANLEEADIGGLGIDLIRHYMDECHYQRQTGRNILILSVMLA